MIHGLASGMLSLIILMLLVGFAIRGTFEFTAPSSVGHLAGLGIVIAADCGLIASRAAQMATLADLPRTPRMLLEHWKLLEERMRLPGKCSRIVGHDHILCVSFSS